MSQIPNENSKNPPESKSPNRASAEERRVVDRRRHDRIWLPAYVVQDYGFQMGTHGLALYLVLCHHAAGHSRECWPSIARLADEAGTSRSTIERSIRLLEGLGLLLREPRLDQWGQRSNLYILIDPKVQIDTSDHLYTLPGPPVPETAPPLPIEGGAPSQGRGGAVLLTAPIEPIKWEPEKRERESPPPSMLRDSCEEAELVAKTFMALAICTLAPRRAELATEIRVEASELLRRGYSVGQLLASLGEPDRDRTEYPRQWRQRIGAGKCARQPATAARADAPDPARQKRLEEEETARQELLAAGGFSELVRRRIVAAKTALVAGDQGVAGEPAPENPK